MRVDVVTIFPGMFRAVLGESLIKRARSKGLLDIRLHDLRAFTHDKRRTVDDRPYGGGPGMIMKPEPIFEAVAAICPARARRTRRAGRGSCEVILMSPTGERLSPQLARTLAKRRRLVILCGHYEGVDERVKTLLDRSVSIGDYVLTGGELPAMVLLDCVARYVPGVIGHRDATAEESFTNGLLEYPQYTRPAVFRGLEVPRALREGDHRGIATWRKLQATARTMAARPDLLASRPSARRGR